MSRGPSSKRVRSKRWVATTSGVVAGLLLVIAVLSIWREEMPRLSNMLHAKTNPATPQPIHISSPREPDRETVLLIGTDARHGDPLGNSDVLCVASLDMAAKRIELLSIPRDTQIAYPDGVYRKINDALAQGGPEMTVRMVQSLIGIPINHYAVTHFAGLVKMIDDLGGIQLRVPHAMHYRTGDKQYGVIDLKKGLQHLNGEQALGFVRFRHDALGDIGRTERQQAFLIALQHELTKPSNLAHLPNLVLDFGKTVDTDMNFVDLGYLAKNAKLYASFPAIHETLPGSFHDPKLGQVGDLSYWIVNPKQARYTSHQFFEEGRVQQNPIQDPNQTHAWTVHTANTT